jgi:LmeA-like phospholipid-binding
MRKFLIALVILVIVLVVIDRAGLFIAERQISTRVQAAYNLPAKPGVSIAGFPFLTQVASGNYQQIDVSIKASDTDGVRLQDINAKFTGVHASLSLLLGQNSGDITAAHASGTATIPFSQVQQRLPRGVTIGPDGGNQLTVAGATAFGAIRGTARLGVSSSGITITPERLTVAGLSSGALAGRFTFTIPVGALPLHLTISGVHVTRGGLVVDATGQNVRFVSA